MYHYIYSLPLQQVWALMVVTMPLWAFGQLRQGRSLRVWKRINCILLLCSVALIISFTILRREPGSVGVNLTPFHSIADAKTQPEFYRLILMNVLLFFPLGLSLSSLLPQRLSIGRRVGLTVLAGLLLSLSVELAQLVFRLGTAELDDLMTNTLGTFIGALQLPLSHCLNKLKR